MGLEAQRPEQKHRPIREFDGTDPGAVRQRVAGVGWIELKRMQPMRVGHRKHSVNLQPGSETPGLPAVDVLAYYGQLGLQRDVVSPEDEPLVGVVDILR